MLVIGVAGGIACGKSSVAECFQQLGAAVLNADQIGHQVLYEPSVKQKIRENWGDMVFGNGEVDRSALGRIVFDPLRGPSELAKLEQITHPLIGQRIRNVLIQLEQENRPAVVLDAPVMFKAGWDRLCDKIVFVHAEKATRQQRVAVRGWLPEELKRRESNQFSLVTKRSRATDVIDNSLSIEETFLQIKDLWRRWRLPDPDSNPS